MSHAIIPVGVEKRPLHGCSMRTNKTAGEDGSHQLNKPSVGRFKSASVEIEILKVIFKVDV
jgi:hypothetical protein